MEEALAILAGLMPAEQFAGLTLSQWATIASAVYNALPEERALLAKLQPGLAAIEQSFAKGLPTLVAAGKAREVAQTIPGYAADGSVIEIPNPDATSGQ